jgi:type IV fimbrial biogenesis protein FimT
MRQVMETRPHRRLAQRDGFSLPELLLVIVIIGITAKLAMPAFTGMMTSGRLSGAVIMVQGDLAMARLQAIRRGSTASFRAASTGATSYTITIDTSGTTIRTVKTGSLRDYKNTTVSAPNGVITFTSRGLLLSPAVGSATGYAKVTLTRGSKTDSVQVFSNGRIYHAQ